MRNKDFVISKAEKVEIYLSQINSLRRSNAEIDEINKVIQKCMDCLGDIKSAVEREPLS